MIFILRRIFILLFISYQLHFRNPYIFALSLIFTLSMEKLSVFTEVN